MYETSACAFHPFSSEAYVYSMLCVRERQTDSQTDRESDRNREKKELKKKN